VFPRKESLREVLVDILAKRARWQVRFEHLLYFPSGESPAFASSIVHDPNSPGVEADGEAADRDDFSISRAMLQ
jgi:hypothetical protein